VICTLIFGTLELGRGVMVQHILEEAARAGCGVACLEGAKTKDVTDIIDQAMDAARISGYTVTLDPDPPSKSDFLDPITVSVSVPYGEVTWLPKFWFMEGTVLTGVCVMPTVDEHGSKKSSSKKSSSKKSSSKKST
jgi:hypothetical protein